MFFRFGIKKRMIPQINYKIWIISPFYSLDSTSLTTKSSLNKFNLCNVMLPILIIFVSFLLSFLNRMYKSRLFFMWICIHEIQKSTSAKSKVFRYWFCWISFFESVDMMKQEVEPVLKRPRLHCGLPAVQRQEGNQTGRGNIASIYDQIVLALCGHQARLQSYHRRLCAV